MKKLIHSWGCLLFGVIVFAVLVIVWKLNVPLMPSREPLFSCRMSNDVDHFKIILPFIAKGLLRDADVVVVGDSRTYADIDPDVFNRMAGVKLFNYSGGQGDGGQLLYILEKLKQFPPKKLIITLSPLSIRLKFDQVDEKLRSQPNWVTFRKIFDQTLDHTLHILRSRFVATIIIHGEASSLLAKDRDGYFACPLSGFGPRVDKKINQHGSDNEYKKLLDKYHYRVKERMPELEREIIAMKNIGWKIICVRLPISPSLRKIEDDYFDNNVFGSLCKKSGVDYIDYSMADFPTHDGSHLAIDEAHRFSAKLTSDLISSNFISVNNRELAFSR